MTGFVFLYKQQGMTSFSACSRLRRFFGTKKLGHTGTLDPMATGVLPVAVGGATRFIELIPDRDKSYRARLRLGIMTDTLDITGQVLKTAPYEADSQKVRKVLEKFRGEQYQLPPMYSALKKDGVRLYEYARQGVEIEREKRKITVYSLELTDADEEKGEYELQVSCSSGTYIRSLIDDIGRELGTFAVMTELERTCANGISVKSCLTLDELEQLSVKGESDRALHPVDEFLGFPAVRVSEAQARRFSNGGELDCNRFGGADKPGLYCVYSPSGDFLGVGEVAEDRQSMRVKRVFVNL